MRKTTNYPGDLSNEEWAVPELQIPEEMNSKVIGRPRVYSLREILDGCFYIIKNGCQWRYLPHGFPPYQVLFYYFNCWRKAKAMEKTNDILVKLVRVKSERNEEPGVVLIDLQSVRTGEQAGVKGFDAGKLM